jgi:hypothetical protein
MKKIKIFQMCFLIAEKKNLKMLKLVSMSGFSCCGFFHQQYRKNHMYTRKVFLDLV